MYTYYERVYSNYLMHHGTKGMKWGIRKLREKIGKSYDSDFKAYGRMRDKKFGKSMQKSIEKDKANVVGMKNKYEIKAKRAFDSDKYYHLHNYWYDNKVNAKRASKINNKMNDVFEKNKKTLTKIEKIKSKSYSLAGVSFLGSIGLLTTGIAIGTLGNINNQRLMKTAEALVSASTLSLGVSSIALYNGARYSEKQYAANRAIYSNVKKHTRV